MSDLEYKIYEKEALEKQRDEKKSELDEYKSYMKNASGGITQTRGGEYKGFDLGKAAGTFIERQRERGNQQAVEKAESNREGLEKLLMRMADMYKASFDQPATKDLVSSTDTAGGYLVNDDDRDELLSYARANSVALRRAEIVRMNSDRVTMPREDAKVQLAFSGESSSMSETSATFDQITLESEDLEGYADVSLHLEQDTRTPGGIVGVLLDQFTEAYGQAIDGRVFNGTGSTSSVFEAAGNTHTLGSSTFDSITVDALRYTLGKLEPQRRKNAAWFGEYGVIWNYLYGVKENSQSVLIPDPRNSAGFRVLGYPLEEVIEAPNTDASGEPMLLFGNLQGFKVGERLNTTSLFRDPYTQRVNKRIRYYFFTRVGFKIALPNNFVVVKTA